MAESFDHVLANPPFHTRREPARPSADALKAAANAMAGDSLDRLGALHGGDGPAPAESPP